MKRITITVRPAGQPAERITGLFATTTDATLFGLDRLGEREGSVSARVQQP
jgi:hypothetical protein